MPPKKSPKTSKPTTSKRAQADSELLRILAQQSSVLTSIATALTSPQPSPSAGPSQAPPPSQTIRSIQLPKLSSPDDTTLPAFHDWKQRWLDYSQANQLEYQTTETQHGVLRSALHPDWTMLWNSGRIKITPTTTLTQAITLLEGYLHGKRNPLLDRQQFLRRDQQTGESIDRYYASLKALDDACRYYTDLQCISCKDICEAYCPGCHETYNIAGQLQEFRIRDRLICGLQDKDMQRRVLAEQYSSVLTLERVLDICVAIESSKATEASLTTHHLDNGDVLSVSRKRSTYKSGQGTPTSGRGTSADTCSGCGKPADHTRPECPAYKSQCHNCKLFGHFTAVCRRPRVIEVPPRAIDTEAPAPPPPPSPAPRRNNTVSAAPFGERKLIPITTNINDTESVIGWLPDTGSDIDAISEDDFMKMGAHVSSSMQNKQIDVVAANGQGLGPIGCVPATFLLHGRAYQTILGIYKDLTTPLLSKAGCIALGLIEDNWPFSRLTGKTPALRAITDGTVVPASIPITNDAAHHVRQTLVNEFPEAFDEVNFRAMSGPPMSVKLLPGAIPCRRYHAYNVPLHWKESVKAQLDNMVTKGVIEAVPLGEPLTWCHPMVVVPKKGSSEPRITVDLTGLNKYVCRPAYPTKVPREEIASVTPGMRYFTKLDARWGYWQVPLDEESKKLTSFITPWGSYRFRRNVMGLVSAGDEHNRRGDEALQGISNVKKVVEDILIYDQDFEVHTERVRAVLRRCSEHGITLNAKKIEFAKPEVEWCGFVIGREGYTPAPHLTSALSQFPVPTNKTDVRSFCGLVQQFESFSHRITELSSPIRSLLSASSAFVWEATHQQAFQELIDELCSQRVLAQFCPGRPLRLETDAAQSRGLGFALYQKNHDDEWRLLQVGSRFVTPTESRYSASEIELLAVAWATRKCRLFLLGCPFELIVDHRPLIPIINNKTLDQIDSPRLRRLKEKLSAFRIHAVWRAGTKHTVVDVFSRHPVSVPTEDDFQLENDEPSQLLLAALTTNEFNKDLALESIKTAAAQCTEYQRLLYFVTNGFPIKEKLDSDLQPYWRVHSDLSVEDSLVLLGCRIVIPRTMRNSVLQTLHTSHQGQERTLKRARMSVYWPGMTNDIRNIVTACRECANLLPSQQKEPLCQDPPPEYPFQEVATDIFSYAGYEYLVMVDRFSGWCNVAKCGLTATSGRVIHLLKSWMVDLGIPVKLISDNGPQFASLEFQNFARKWQFHHSTSSPHYPQSNGLAESAVKSIKYLLMKTSPTGNLHDDAFQEGLMELRNTPRADGKSPAILLFGAPTRTRLPVHRERFAKEWNDRVKLCDQRSEVLREKAASHYNTTARELAPLKKGDVVLAQNPRTGRWDTIAEIIEGHHRGRSYVLRTESGGVLRRNRRLLRPFTSAPRQRSEEPMGDVEQQPQEELRRSTLIRRPPTRLTYAQVLEQGSNFQGGHEGCVTTPHHVYRQIRSVTRQNTQC